jgi:hypothetical protein
MEPFRNQTFRCPRCGSMAGPGCNCLDRERWEKERFKTFDSIDYAYCKTPKSKPLKLGYCSECDSLICKCR